MRLPDLLHLGDSGGCRPGPCGLCLGEMCIRDSLGEELKGKTQIVVTQRVTTAKNSDCIFVMDPGRVLDWGRHEELLPRCRVYREIYLSQTGGDAA